MVSVLFTLGAALHLIFAVTASEDNATIPLDNIVDGSQFIMPNSSELPKHEQLEQAANLMFEEYWELYLMNNPDSATISGDHRYDDRLRSNSLRTYEKEKIMKNEFLERANQMLALAPEGCRTQKNLQLFIIYLQREVESIMSGSHLFATSKMYPPEMALRGLMKYMKQNNASEYWNLISRYRAMTKQIDEKIELLREGIRTNLTHSNYSMPTSRRDWDSNIEKSPFYKPFLNISSSVPLDEVAEIQSNASDAVLNYLIPAFQKLEAFIETEYIPNTRPHIGVGSLPNGKELYRQRLSYHLTDDNISPQNIYDTGLAEVARINLEMDEVIQSLGLNMSRQEFNEFLRNDDSQHFSSEEEALQRYRQVLEDEIAPKLGQLFNFIPGKKLIVEKIPKELASGPAAYYTAPSVDNSVPGTFFLDTSNLKNIAAYDVMTLAIHEGVPGHHFQHSYVMERENSLSKPKFMKYGIYSSAFVEGWALYAEYLGYELGLYEDPYLRFGHLSYEMFRACRMVVDPGIHVFGWSRQEAIYYMMDHLAFSLDHVVREVDRYITWPGQACSYKYGEIKIKQLRRRAEDALGETFDIKEFHDIILINAGPLSIVEDQINRYIADNTENVLQ